MRVRGVSYTTGVAPDECVRRDLLAIRGELHCNTVMLIGTDIGRLEGAAKTALDVGLDVYIRPYLADEPHYAILDHLAGTAEMAERLRSLHPDRVTLLLGSEFSFTSRGMIPGRWLLLRLQILVRPCLRRLFDRRITRRLHRFLRRALSTARANFRGPVTYASGYWENVDWAGFDLIGVNLYRLGDDPAGYERRLRALVRDAAKPVVVTEFGCGAFLGADRRGPGSFRAVNWLSDPPTIKKGYTRDEGVQARYLSDLIELYADAGVHGCFVYTFMSPGFPHSSEAKHDLDMAGFGLVKAEPNQPTNWAPKQAFHTVARCFTIDGTVHDRGRRA